MGVVESAWRAESTTYKFRPWDARRGPATDLLRICYGPPHADCTAQGAKSWRWP